MAWKADERGRDWVCPLVCETWDGWLNDINTPAVGSQHVWGALDSASSDPVPNGNTGGGTGMIQVRLVSIIPQMRNMLIGPLV